MIKGKKTAKVGFFSYFHLQNRRVYGIFFLFAIKARMLTALLGANV